MTSMSASEALDYALNGCPEDLGPVPRLVLIYVADSGSLDTAHLAWRTGAPPEQVEAALSYLSRMGYLEAIKGRWVA